ncbi:hypothetical protein C819_03340 [Lachnospiraceae bacterium 10-1]|jgi:sugar/nucleoside kinase (ribokinase family)|nr:hypothetical protein C819_03340 [Lachnospiraceae bacterium 10-1]
MKKILCAGIITCDTMLRGISHMPAPGDAVGLTGVEVHVGGCGGNFAIDLARLGIPVMLSARIGKDRYGDMVMEILGEYKDLIDMRSLVRDSEQGTTFSAVCIFENGERSILCNMGSTLRFSREDIMEECIRDCDIFFVAGSLLLNEFEKNGEAELLKRLQSEGKFTAMDTCYDVEEVWLPKIKDAIPHLDLFMPSYNEAARLSGLENVDEIADFFLQMGAGNVILKMGSKGVYMCCKGKPRHYIPAILNENVVDTTGAGDSFCAGFMAGLALGWDFDRCAMLGNAMGYCCVGSMGPQAGIRPLNEMLPLVEQQEKAAVG